MLELKRLTKVYEDGTLALDDVSFTVREGEFVALVGPSGAGKTTLLKCVNNSLLPTSGEILLNRKNLTRLTSKELSKIRVLISTIYQDFRLVEECSVLTNTLIGSLALSDNFMSLFGKFPPKSVEKAESILKSLSIWHLRNKKIYHISGGQKQRVCVARALMQDPLILLADEPTSNLDRDTALSVVELLKDLSTKRKLAILYSTHDTTLAETHADRIVGLENGKII